MGVRHAGGQADPRPHPLSVHRVEGDPLSSRTAWCPTTSTSRRTASSCPPRWREVNGDQWLRVYNLAGLATGTMNQVSGFRFGQSVPESFVFSPGRPLPVRQQLLHGRVEHLPLRSGHAARSRRSRTPTRTSSGPSRFGRASGRARLHVSRASSPRSSSPSVVKDASAIRFLGTELARKHPVVTQWQVDPPGRRRRREARDRTAGRTSRSATWRSTTPFPSSRATRTRSRWAMRPTSPIRRATRASTSRRRTPVNGDLPSGERPHFEVKGRYIDWWGSLAWNRSDFYDLFGPVKRSRKGFAAKGGYDTFLIYDDPRTLAFTARAGYYANIDTLPYAQNIESGFTRLSELEVGLQVLERPPLAGGAGRREGHQVERVHRAAARDRRDAVVRPRQRRLWLGHPAGQLVDLVADGGRLHQRRSEHLDLELLLRRLRQQLRRQPRHQALPGHVLLPRLRHRRDQRPVVRPPAARMEHHALRFRVGGHADLPPRVDAPGAVRLGAVDRRRKLRRSARTTATSAGRSTSTSP